MRAWQGLDGGVALLPKQWVYTGRWLGKASEVAGMLLCGMVLVDDEGCVDIAIM